MRIDADAAWALVLGAVLLVLGGVPIYKSATANGRVDFCYLDNEPSMPVLRVMGHRPWRSDVVIGAARTTDEGAAIAAAAHCPLWTERKP